jgi:hypothetical protein
LAQEVTLLNFIREIHGSNLDQATDFTDWGFFVIFFISSRQLPEN